MTVTASPVPGSGPPARKVFGEEELFLRDLSEVHLLIDFISGRTDKSLAGLKDAATHDSTGQVCDWMPPQKVIEEICKISYPPEGAIEATAQQAAFMLMVKDKLNYLAAPARGLTVAFTSMVAGVSLSPGPPLWRRLLGLLGPLLGLLRRVFGFSGRDLGPLKRKDDRDGERKNDRDAKALAREEQHFFSAAKAYPNLEDQARRFRGLYSRLPFWAVVLVAFIVWANWDVSVTSSVLQRLHNNEAAIDKFMQLNGVSAATCPSPTQSASCDHLNAMRERLGADRINLHGLVGHGLVGWFHPVGLSVRLLGLVEHARDTQRASGAKSAASELSDPSVPERIESLTNDVIGGLNGIVIPAAFGWLGTLAGLMRSITVKMRDSILAPRDLMVARIGSCLGVSAGLAVGLFFSTDLSGNAAKALDGTITISAAGLSFLAGFGAETFFTFLDTVLVRLLPTNQAPGR